MTPLIILDCETSGLRPDRHTIWDIAWVTAIHHPAGGRVVVDFDGSDKLLTWRPQLEIKRRFEARVPLNFREMKNADRESLKIGRWEERHTTGMLEREAVIGKLQADISRLVYPLADDEGACPLPHLVGAVPSFDHAMLCENWVGWPGYGEGLWHYHLIDVEVLAAGKLGIPPPYTSSQLASALGIIQDEATKHTAMGDVRWAIEMYAAVYDLEVIDERHDRA